MVAMRYYWEFEEGVLTILFEKHKDCDLEDSVVAAATIEWVTSFCINN